MSHRTLIELNHDFDWSSLERFRKTLLPEHLPQGARVIETRHHSQESVIERLARQSNAKQTIEVVNRASDTPARIPKVLEKLPKGQKLADYREPNPVEPPTDVPHETFARPVVGVPNKSSPPRTPPQKASGGGLTMHRSNRKKEV